MKKLFLIIFALAVVTIPSLSFAGDSAHGDDPLKARAKKIKKFINEELKGAVFQYVDQVSEKSLTDPQALSLLSSMIVLGLKEDINLSPYEPTGNCKEGTESRAASAAEGTRDKPVHGSICFDPLLLAKENISSEELVAVALHEHAHHFGATESEAINLEANIKAGYKDPKQQVAWSCSGYCKIQYWSKYWFNDMSEVMVSADAATPTDALKSLFKSCDEYGQSIKKAHNSRVYQVEGISTRGWNVDGTSRVNVQNACVNNKSLADVFGK